MRQPVPLQPSSAVTSFPWPLRLLFASRPDALGRCLAVIVRAIQTDLTHRAGLTASSGARTGVITLIQRFGSALNLNLHLHMLILDGVYTLEQNGPRFHRVEAPDARSLELLINRLVRRIVRRLTRDGLLIEDPEQPWLDPERSDTLDHLNAASIRYRIAVGQGAGGRTLTLKNPFRDGTTHILFSPEDFIARLAALVPRPRINLTRYHGVFAPSSPIRRAIVPTPAGGRQRRISKDSAPDLGPAAQARIRNRHHKLPALRRAASRDCRYHRSGPHPQYPRSRSKARTTKATATTRGVRYNLSRSVCQTPINPRRPSRLRVPFLGFPFHPYTRTTTATTAVRSPSHPDRCRSTGPTPPATPTPAILLATREKTRYLPYSPILFAFSTMITWSYYGVKAFTYLVGHHRWADLGFKIFFLAFVVLGSSVQLGAVVDLSDALVFVVAVPNLLGLYLLAPLIKKELTDYEAKKEAQKN